MPAVRKLKKKDEAPSETLGAQMALMRKRTKRTCDNPECGKEFEALSIGKYCSDECRWRAAYLERKAAAE